MTHKMIWNHLISEASLNSNIIMLNNIIEIKLLVVFRNIFVSFHVTLKESYRIKGRIRTCGFLRIFTVAFLVFLAPAGQSNPYITHDPQMWKYGETPCSFTSYLSVNRYAIYLIHEKIGRGCDWMGLWIYTSEFCW